MVVTVFRSRLRPENADEFDALAQGLMDLARSMPGFVSYRVYVAEDGERASIVEFETAAELRAWREHPRHRAAQERGREHFYTEYTLAVGDVVRESRFERPEDAPAQPRST